jgi:hypothetical protein
MIDSIYTMCIDKLYNEYKEYALKHYKRHSLGSVHVAFIIKHKKIIAVAANKVGSRSNGSGYSAKSLHAEKAVVKALGDMSQLRGATLIVIRVMKGTQEINYSAPCHSCQCFLDKAQREWGLRRVIHS